MRSHCRTINEYVSSHYGTRPEQHSFPTRRSSDLRRNIRRRITIPLTLSNLKLLRRITRTENILHRNFTRWQVAIQNRRSEERFSRNAETDLVCRLLLEKKNH